MVDPEQGLEALDGQALDRVDVLLAFVVTLAGVSLGVLVVENAAAGLHHGPAGVVFARDESQLVVLTLLFVGDALGDFRVGFDEG